jgi:hypothetical protein
VHADFEVYGGALGMSCCCLYGGAPYHSQEVKLKRGVDIVIGTPGRIKVTFNYCLHCSQNFQLHYDIQCGNFGLCIYVPYRFPSNFVLGSHREGEY